VLPGVGRQAPVALGKLQLLPQNPQSVTLVRAVSQPAPPQCPKPGGQSFASHWP